MTKRKDKVIISAGATVIVESETGAQQKFGCTGSNQRTKKTPAQVIKSIQDCIEKSVKQAASSSLGRK